MGRVGETAFGSVIPESDIEAVKRTQSNLKEFETNLLQCLSMADPDTVAEMPPLQRAQLFLVLAKSATALFTLRLRGSGIHPENHAVKSEMERLKLFEEKLSRYNDWNKAPIRPSTTINYKAATRFIEHSLPDLTPEQRKGMREISKGTRRPDKHVPHKKRKCQSSEQKSTRIRAAEFLEKAVKEILGPDTDGTTGPLLCGISNEDDMQTT